MARGIVASGRPRESDELSLSRNGAGYVVERTAPIAQRVPSWKYDGFSRFEDHDVNGNWCVLRDCATRPPAEVFECLLQRTTQNAKRQ
jgi:hypothetical protein